jgi:hypothetical protein
MFAVTAVDGNKFERGQWSHLDHTGIAMGLIDSRLFMKTAMKSLPFTSKVDQLRNGSFSRL